MVPEAKETNSFRAPSAVWKTSPFVPCSFSSFCKNEQMPSTFEITSAENRLGKSRYVLTSEGRFFMDAAQRTSRSARAGMGFSSTIFQRGFSEKPAMHQNSAAISKRLDFFTGKPVDCHRTSFLSGSHWFAPYHRGKHCHPPPRR